MLTQAAMTLTNVQRWAQRRTLQIASDRSGDGHTTVVPTAIRDAAKTKQYEVSVVDAFIQLGAQSFALHGSEAIWERPFPSGNRGRPIAVDVALFNAARSEESRLEFGEYSRRKLADDSRKLAGLPAADGLRVTNYLILWRLGPGPLRKTSNGWRDECVQAASAASRAGEYDVELRVASSQHVFVAAPNADTVADVGLFSVHLAGVDDVDEIDDL
ncbi:hypothetical protein IC607_08695 [Cellulomonas sp. JH27-2]|uniref:hypothetical protein n=1 Tax=Cellulomonas sp. JH27-2 TaxID=2774139 RepID=UPI001785005D|nr:hypothetical protein [Cellulomonas sp. JH27-2]MBD8059045.1 hypothetical protein [Cellulomonas sp. JH27-2]